MRSPPGTSIGPVSTEPRAACGALDGAVEIRDADVAEPIRGAGFAGRAFVEHAAELAAIAAEDQVHAHRAHVVLADLVPAEQRGVERERDVRRDVRRELVPRELARAAARPRSFGRRLSEA